jgi:hypothetical protein
MGERPHAEEATMPVPTIRDEPHHAIDPDSPVEERIEARLARIEQRVEVGNREGRKAGRAFMIFAVTAVFLAMVELVAIAAKLDNTAATNSTATKQAAPAAPTAAAPAPVAAARIGVTLKEYSVAPSPAVGSAGKVTFNVQNAGAIPHEFVVLRTAKPAGSLLKAPRPTRPATSARSATSSRARPRP